MITIKSINTLFEKNKKGIGHLLNVKIKEKPQEFRVSPERQRILDAETLQRLRTSYRKYPWLDSKTSAYVENIEERLESLGNPSGLTMEQREANLNKRLKNLNASPPNRPNRPEPLNQKQQHDIQAELMRIHEATEKERQLQKKQEDIDDILMKAFDA